MSLFYIDRSVQESDRLDTPLNRFRSTNSRTHISDCASIRRIPIIQHRELPAYPRTVDAHVHYSESKLDPHGLYTIHRRERE